MNPLWVRLTLASHASAAGSPSIQRKPAVSHPGDSYEREADVVADKVTRMAEPASIGSAHATIQRACAECKDEKGPIQNKRTPSTSAGAELDIAAAHHAAEHGGEPLPNEVRSHFEPHFGHDFSRVRLHISDDAARAVQARAYTVGPNIVFGRGEYAPGTAEGRRLLAHELTHTIQQGAAPPLHGQAESRSFRSAGPMIQRDLAAYDRAHTEYQPNYGESASTIYTTDSADASRVRTALAALLGAGKVGTRTVGDTVIFYNTSATATELETALAGFSRGREMAAKLLDAHNIWLYSRESLTQMTTFFWTQTISQQHENLNAQNRRRLTEYERSQATRVFGGSLALDNIVLEEDPIMSVGGYARTTPWTINFPTGSYSGSGFMRWLIHELTHSWQYQHGVSLATTFYHAVRAHYDYGGESGLRAAHAAGQGFRSFNTEQQASIVADYWYRSSQVPPLDVSAWQPFIDELRAP